MRRRDFVALLACAAPGRVARGGAQQPTIPVIEFLEGFCRGRRPDQLPSRLRLRVVGSYQPAAVEFLIDVGDDVVGLSVCAILHFRVPALLTHLPREVTVDVNVLV
jgi:hypothetical protein